jgi:thioredoxin-related protein
MQSGKQREKVGLLQNFLMNYDDTGSKFYQEGIKEYEKRREAYNNWLVKMVKQDKDLFISSLYRFQHIPPTLWKGDEQQRLLSLIDNYFEGLDFNDSIIIRTTEINQWMNNYVNLYGQMATSEALRDSLFPLAAKRAIEKAKTGHPIVYGWIVDYFYRGFESNAIPAGMKVLETYMADPNCLTSKRLEIERRLKGMQTLVVGSTAPNISMKDKDGLLFDLNLLNISEKYILLVFWSADCSHCMEMVNKIYPELSKPEMLSRVKTVAISLDETSTEIAAWDKKIPSFPAWKHIRAEEGIRSKVANDYYILATPVMILLDAKTMKISALPNNPAELSESLK